MPVSLITAATTLRVLVGIVGVGYSLYSNQTEKGNFDFRKIPEAIFGETVGSFFADWLKEGTTVAYDALIGKLQLTAEDPLIYELQVAVRKAQLTATLMACRSCIDRLDLENHTQLERLKSKVVNSEELAWLSAVVTDLEEQLATPFPLPTQKGDYEEIFSVFDKEKMKSEDTTIEEFKSRSKEAVLRDIRNRYYSTLKGQRGVAFSEDGYKLLEEAIVNGWVNLKLPQGSIVQLGIIDGGLADAAPAQDWFELVCLIFNGDFKTNQRVQTALLREDTEITKTTLLNFVSSGLESLGRLERDLSELTSTVTEFRKENLLQSELTNEKLDDMKGMLKTVLTQVLSEHGVSETGFSAERNSVLEMFTPPPMEGMVARTSLVDRLRERLLDSNFLLLYGSSGMGKSVLSYQISINTGLPWQRIEMRGLAPLEIHQRLLNAREAIEISSGSNILIDDLNFDKDVHIYDKALANFLNAAKRTSSKVIISSQNTLPIELASLYATGTDVSVNVPALDIDEIKVLASIHGCQGSKLLQWSNLVWAQTKGHPLLAHARILNIARTGWLAPSAEDLVSPVSIEEARQKVRQKLEETLDSDERTLVYRLSVFPDRFKRENALSMGQHSPNLSLPGEIFDRLVGPWIEPLDSVYFRLSPLLEGNAKKVFGAEETKLLHRTAADSLIKPKTVSHVEFGGLLMHGILGDYPKAFFAALMAWFGVADEHERSIADYVGWFRYIALDRSIVSDPFGNAFARMLQFEIAALIDSTAASKIALRWEAELQEMYTATKPEYPEFFLHSLEARFLQTVLFTDAVRFPFEKIAVWTARMISTLPQLSRTFEGIPQEIRREDASLPEVFESLQNPTFFLGNIIVKCKRASDALGFLSALDSSKSSEVEMVWQLLREQPSAVVLLVDRIWLDGARNPSPNWHMRLKQLDEVTDIAVRRKVDALCATASVAKAIIYQEYLDDTEQALAQLNASNKRLGYEHDDIANYRAKIFLLTKQYTEAVTIWKELLPRLVKEKHFGRLFFCRDAETAAAALGQWEEVVEFALLGAGMAQNAFWGYPEHNIEDIISVSYHGDAALAFWNQGNAQRALTEIKDILARLQETPVESLDDNTRLLYLRLHYCLTWMSSDPSDTRFADIPAGYFTNPNKFEEVVQNARTVPYTHLWYLLAEIEFRTRSGVEYLNRLKEELVTEPNRVYEFASVLLSLKHSITNLEFENLVTDYNRMLQKYGETDARETLVGDFKRFLLTAVIYNLSLQMPNTIPFEKWKSDFRESAYYEIVEWLDLLQLSLEKKKHFLVTTLVDGNAEPDARLISATILTFTDALNPRERFYANALFLTSTNFHNWQDVIEKAVGERIASHWRQIGFYQRFALSNPAVNAPAIISAAEDTTRSGFALGAHVILTAVNATDLRLGDNTVNQLKELSTKVKRKVGNEPEEVR